MEYTYPPSNEVGRDDNQLCPQSAKETFVNDYPLCMYDYPQATTSRYSVQSSLIITPINTPIGFFTTCELFPWHYPMCDCSSRESATVETIYTLFTKTSTKFCCVSFSVSIDYQSVWILFGTNSCTISFTFQSHVMIKEQLKQAVLELAQPLLMNLLPCSRCNIKHYKKSCMHPFLPNTNHENGR